MPLDTIQLTDTFEQWRVKDNAAIALLNSHDTALAALQSSATTTYYVRADGNDANDGLTNTAGGAFLTVQAALTAASKRNVTKGTTITISVAAGTFTGQIVAAGANPGSLSNSGGTDWQAPIIITGPSTAILTSNNADATITVGPNSVVRLAGGIRIQAAGTTGLRHGIAVHGGGLVDVNSATFGACTGDHINASEGALVLLSGNYSIVGAAARHIAAGTGAVVSGNALTVTLTGTPAFSPFMHSSGGATIFYTGMTFTGSATGSRYTATTRGSIFTGGSITYLPGNAAGTLSLGGCYEDQVVLGKLDGTAIGSVTPSTGAFTTLSSTGAASVQSLSATAGVSGATVTATGAVSGDSVAATAGVTGATGTFSTSLTASGQSELRGTVYLGGSAIGNESLRLTTVASAVNRLVGKGAATGVAPSFSVDGTDANVGLELWTKGTGTLRLGTNTNLPVLDLLHAASAVNYWSMTGAATGAAVTIKPLGTDANIAANYESKGTASLFLRTGGGTQVEVRNVTGVGNRILLEGNTTGRVFYGAEGAEANIGLTLRPKGSGDVYCTSQFTAASNITAYSDEKLKKNWRDLPENFVEKLAKLKSGIFDRTDREETQVGVSAQSLKRLLPNAVTKSGKWLTVAYGNAALVACVELAKRLVTQQKEISDLKRRLDKLEKVSK
jgi:hypothetical protein